MATVGTTRPKAKSKRSSTTRGSSRPSKRSGGPRAAGSRTAGRHQASGGVTATVGSALEGRYADVIGLTLIGIAVIAGAGLYADVAGPVGRLFAAAASGLVGLGAALVPPVLVLVGIALIRDPDPVTGSGAVGRAHLAVGGVLLGVAATGLLHVGRGSPSLADGLDAWGSAGGLVGMAVGAPLLAVAATWGAVVVLVTLLLIAFFVITRIPVRVAAEGAVATFRPLHEAVRGAFASLFHLDSADGTADLGPSDGRIDITVGGEPLPDDGPYDGGADLDEPLPPEPADDGPVEVSVPAPDVEPEQLGLRLAPAAGSWVLPPAKLLVRTGNQEVDREAIEDDGRRLEASLSQHGVETRLVGMVVGPTVTRYELELGPGVKVNKVTSLAKDIAYNMATPDVRILAPIPGKQAIGIEVPNARRQLVAVGDILASTEAAKATHPLEVAVGRDINGKSHMMNLASMPHILIAGATGAGKSSCLNSILTSILMRSTPDQVRMILVDPKRVEMGQYDGLPHLLTQVVTNPKKAANALAWAVKEMERRYDLLSEIGVRDITGYNEAYDRGDLDELDDRVRSAGAPDEEPQPKYQRLPVRHRRGRRAGRPHDGGGARRRGIDLPHRPDGPRRGHPPHHRHPAPLGERHHGCHQGQRARPARLRRLQRHRLARHPRPDRRGTTRRQGRHALPRSHQLEPAPDPGLLGHRGRGAQDRRPLEAAGAGGDLRRGGPGRGRHGRRRHPAREGARATRTTTTWPCRPWS